MCNTLKKLLKMVLMGFEDADRMSFRIGVRLCVKNRKHYIICLDGILKIFKTKFLFLSLTY